MPYIKKQFPDLSEEEHEQVFTETLVAFADDGAKKTLRPPEGVELERSQFMNQWLRLVCNNKGNDIRRKKYTLKRGREYQIVSMDQPIAGKDMPLGDVVPDVPALSDEVRERFAVVVSIAEALAARSGWTARATFWQCRFLMDMSTMEVAEHSKTTVGTVASGVHQARAVILAVWVLMEADPSLSASAAVAAHFRNH
jgi:DNA-directed RNA polymerase specialized sigma24 family protein